jgi:hypothetical protein
MQYRAGIASGKSLSRRGGTYARGWHIDGVFGVSVLFQVNCLSIDLSKNGMKLAQAAESCQENNAGR